jgi:hypothetical protein
MKIPRVLWLHSVCCKISNPFKSFLIQCCACLAKASDYRPWCWPTSLKVTWAALFAATQRATTTSLQTSCYSMYTFLAPEVLLLSSDPRNLRHNSNPGSNLQEPHFRIGGNQQFVGVHLIWHAMHGIRHKRIHWSTSISLVFGPRTLGMRPSRLAMAFHSMASRGRGRHQLLVKDMFSTWCRNEWVLCCEYFLYLFKS